MLDMKKSFHVFFLFTLMALFAVNAAWATCPEGFEEETGTGNCYVKLPTKDNMSVVIPNGMTSFKVYDDGGKDGNYASNANGCAFLNAPVGYKMRISGNVDLGTANFSLEDGVASIYSKSCSGEGCTDNFSYDDVGKYVRVCLRSNGLNESHAGLEMTVSLFDAVKDVEEVNLSDDDGYYINMPADGAKEVKIPNNVKSFKVYDDGGKDMQYSNKDDGYLVLTAPEGLVLMLTGTVSVENRYCDQLFAFDGGINDPVLLDSAGGENANESVDIGLVLSSGRTMTLAFRSDYSVVYDGLDLTVSVVGDPTTPRTITINQATGGTAKAFVSSVEVNSALVGTEVNVVVDLEEGFQLQGVNVIDENHVTHHINRTDWPVSNEVSFTMPALAVTVTPIIVPAGEVYVNMPATGLKSMELPSGTTSFHIYSDGGKDGIYSNNADGTLILNAPYNSVLQLTGNIKTQTGKDYLTVYDGYNEDRTILEKVSSASIGEAFDIGTIVSTGHYMKLNFVSDDEKNYEGLDLVVSVVSPSEHKLNISGLEHGAVRGQTTGILPGNTVVLTVAPNEGYLLNGVRAVDKWGNTLKVSGGAWYSSNVVSFKMPSSDVDVSVELVQKSEAVVYLPTKDNMSVVIPNGMTSLKVYDDGGKDGNYASNANGCAYLYAPVGYKMRISGNVDLGTANFSLEDGVTSIYSKSCSGEGCTDNFSYDDVGKYVRVCLRSNGLNESHAGLEMTVSLFDAVKDVEEVNLSDDDGYYINMPADGAKEVKIPNNVKSFKVYDDGGKDMQYSNKDDGYLVLTAPEGLVLMLTGTVSVENRYCDQLFAFDGGINDPVLLDSAGGENANESVDIGLVLSSGRTMTLAFRSDYSVVYDGLDLTVSVVQPAKYAAVTVVEDETHKKYGFIDGMYNDADTIKIPSPIAVDTLIFKREFSMQGYSTIMLPFGIEQTKVDGIGQVLEFDGVSEVDGELQVNMVVHDGDLEANHPYMLRLSEEKLVFHGGVTLNSMSDPAIRKGDWVFHGTLAKRVWNKDDPDLSKVYGFSAEQRSTFEIGDFVKFGARSWIRPLRAYMIKDPVPVPLARRYAYDWTSSLDTETSIDSLPERIKVVIVERGEDSEDGEEHTTVIGHINTRTGEFTMERNYDLKGRKLNGKPKARGAYYGKKVLVK